MIEVLLHNETDFDVSDVRLQAVVSKIATDHGYQAGEISLAVVDDSTIHRLNREHLRHDYPTDVLSFLLEDDTSLEGEVVVSADTARRVAAEYGWSPHEELLLYVIHGTLHLVGYDDHTPEDRETMRLREVHYLAFLNVVPPAGHACRPPRDVEASP